MISRYDNIMIMIACDDNTMSTIIWYDNIMIVINLYQILW